MNDKYTIIFFLAGEAVDEQYADSLEEALTTANEAIENEIRPVGEGKVEYNATYVIIRPGDYKA